MSPEEKRNSLPFEPRSKRKKKQKQAPAAASDAPAALQDVKKTASTEASLSAIPDAVSKRMIRRMALFSGVPTALGISSFLISYWIVRQELFELPTVAVLFTSAGLFGLGVLGLSYGVLSTSWDEERSGGLWGFEEFKLNWGRMTEAWRSARKQKRGEPSP
ncbi:PAM68 family protein [Oscillatoria sp. FACHB-1406]|uniref:PAM68 family protein n=1 Tax=Oscillatoria sp. FACHB-1406 TaxID=2692846 RepID=UPI001689A850|nr:PAM68 family protein [Oscillatoria sp. FACHB-1406]MBD2578513.1 PAM68 family protein [Oscillatoria sp. FACHB-1406]